jgi:hypothetical protein
MNIVKMRFIIMNAVFVVTLVLFAISRMAKSSYPQSFFYYAVMTVMVTVAVVGLFTILWYWIALGHAKNYRTAFQVDPPSTDKDRRDNHGLVLRTMSRYASDFLVACDTEQTVKMTEFTGFDANETRDTALRQAAKRIRVLKATLRDAQNAANFFGYKVPKRVREIADCKSIL